MKDVVYDDPAELVAWAQERTGHTYFSDATAIGIKDETGIRGVTVFDSFTKTGCWVHVASDGSGRWFNRDYITCIFAYPFIQLGYPRISAWVSEKNAASLRFTEHFGWVREGVMRRAGFDGEDIITFGMLRSECRYLPPLITGNPGPVRL
ncbi:GNAT family protein [Ciceribacter sp. L1K22]|uniref:GNAT family N-acetyltransferase n=1 Tax=Ciceribacter sp. L1K22 TaxID=2820275 RepID=UPI001ABDFB83|nr:GNAT family protein [Ciceribacter sp. L1K22]MBO3760350.1 GNAT family N-acetyltransferase [Ciceribacter sp. L1K22]